MGRQVNLNMKCKNRTLIGLKDIDADSWEKKFWRKNRTLIGLKEGGEKINDWSNYCKNRTLIGLKVHIRQITSQKHIR